LIAALRKTKKGARGRLFRENRRCNQGVKVAVTL